MKSKIYITSLLAVTLLISSCGSLSISQKRYSRGLNVDLFNAKEEKKSDVKAKVATKKTPAKHEVQGETNTETTVAEVTPAENKDIVALQPEQAKQTNGIASTHHNAVSKFKNIKAIKNSIQELKSQQPESNYTNTLIKNAAEKTDSDVALLILIIIALFIPPLAVFLYFGEANTQFWISLLLTLLAIGAFGIGVFFGWGIPVIHALLVLFGIFG